MPGTAEREPIDRESLIFTSSEEGQEFAERVETRAASNEIKGVKRQREALAIEVAEEFAKYGYEVGSYDKPWKHNEAEHKQVQELVNIAFTDDLGAALKTIRKNPEFPRIVDLFHDVLTGQLYEEMVSGKLDKQHLKTRATMVGVGVMLTLLILLVLVILL